MKKYVKLAVCIPTYNRPKVIAEFIEKYAPEYIKYNFDIYIYDSSEDKQTELIAKEGMKQNTNLYYVRVDSAVHSNMKVYNIFKEFGNLSQYEYLWVCSDSIRWSSHALSLIYDSIKQDYDIIIPNYRDVENIGNKEYKDANELFQECAWHMTLYGATILKISTMLTDVSWEMLIEKYTVPDCINHSHVAYYFEKLYNMNNWKALHLSLPNSDLIASGLKKHSGWQKETFYVWCYCWPSMIHKLPEYYKNKANVIKKCGINSGILTYSNFVNLRENHILNIDIYRYYRKKWHELTNVPHIIIWILSVFPTGYVTCLGSSQAAGWFIKQWMLKRRIKRYCRKFDIVYIYGAGKKATRYTMYLNEMNIKFEAYLVSGQVDDTKMLNEHKVVSFCSNLVREEKTGILLALNEENTKQVLEQTLGDINRQRIFTEYEFE